MFFRNIIILAFGLATAMLWTHCGKSGAILSPNDPDARKPILTLTGSTSYWGTAGLPAARRLATVDTAAINLVQCSSHPKLMMIWKVDSTVKDTINFQVSQTATGWPLRFRADIFEVPSSKMLRPVPGSPTSYYGIAELVLFNDENSNNQFDYYDETVRQMGHQLDTMTSGPIWDSLFYAMMNYAFVRKPNKDWLMGLSAKAGILYLSDSAALNYIESKLASSPDTTGKYRWQGLHTGYNVMQAINVRHDAPPASMPTVLMPGYCDGFRSVESTTEIDMGLVANVTDCIALSFTGVTLEYPTW